VTLVGWKELGRWCRGKKVAPPGGGYWKQETGIFPLALKLDRFPRAGVSQLEERKEKDQVKDDVVVPI
jgi:hypothetical protein